MHIYKWQELFAPLYWSETLNWGLHGKGDLGETSSGQARSATEFSEQGNVQTPRVAKCFLTH
jgi:hypothetical protein